MPDLRGAAALLDTLLPEPALLYGSPPYDAADLDLLVRPAAAAALAAALPPHGFTPWHGGWMRVCGCTTEVVEPEPAQDWGLDPRELDRLYADAVPLPGLTHVVAPSPHHLLLVLARRLQRSGGLDTRRLARARTALAAEPDALRTAAELAPAWGCAPALHTLAQLLAGGPVPATAAPVRRVVRRLVRRPARGAVVAICGLDGAGKSTQAQALAASLDSLGYDTVVLWDRISYDAVLSRVGGLVKTALRRGRPASPAAQTGSASPPTGAPAPEGAVEGLPRPLRALWVALVTLAHILSAGSSTRRHLRQGRVVVRDRYVLDSVVHLHDRYGDVVELQPYARALQMLLPSPLGTWFLDVTAEEAYRRKPEQFDVAHLTRQRQAYLAAAPRLGVSTLDATRPPGELCGTVLADVLVRLTAAGVPRPG